MSRDENRIEELENQIEELKSKLDALNESKNSASSDEGENPEASEGEEVEESKESAEEGKTEEKVKKKTSQVKGNQASLFSSETVTAFSAVANSEEMEHKYRIAVASRMAIVMAILTVIATVLRLLSFNLPFLPSVLNFDFSALPEVIASIAYGPVFGVIIVIIKNLLYIGIKIKTLSVTSVITNVVLNSIFVFITGAHYSRKMFPLDPEYQPTRDLRRLHILGGGTIGAGVSAVASYFLTRFVTLPILYKTYPAYNEGYIIYVYQQALDNLNSMLPEKLQGIVEGIVTIKRALLIYNVPHTFIKYFIMTLLAAILYNFLSPFLHFRNKMPMEEENEEYEYQQNNNLNK